MTDAAPDNEKRTHSAVLFVLAMMLVYVLSYPIVQAYAIRFARPNGKTKHVVWAMLDVIYWPMDNFFTVVGLAEPVTELLYWLAETLP